MKPFTMNHLAIADAPEVVDAKKRLASPDSLISRCTTMHLGESISHIKHVDFGTMSALEVNATKMRDAVRDSVNSSVRLAAKKTGNKYSIEVTHVLPPSGRVFILAIVTRTE